MSNLRRQVGSRNKNTSCYKNEYYVCVCVLGGGGGGGAEPGLVDRVLALHAGSRGLDSHRGHMSEQFFRSNRP